MRSIFSFIVLAFVFSSSYSWGQAALADEAVDAVTALRKAIKETPHTRLMNAAGAVTRSAGEATVAATKSNEKLVEKIRFAYLENKQGLVRRVKNRALVNGKKTNDIFSSQKKFQSTVTTIMGRLNIKNADHPAVLDALDGYMNALAEGKLSMFLANLGPETIKSAKGASTAERGLLANVLRSMGKVDVDGAAPVNMAEFYEKLSASQQQQVAEWFVHWERADTAVSLDRAPRIYDDAVSFMLDVLAHNRLTRSAKSAGKSSETLAMFPTSKSAAKILSNSEALGSKHGKAMGDSIENMVENGMITEEAASDFIKAVGKNNSTLRGLKPDNPLLKTPQSRQDLVSAFTLLRAQRTGNALSESPARLLQRLSNFDPASIRGVNVLLLDTPNPKKARAILAQMESGLSKEIKSLEEQIAKFKQTGKSDLPHAESRLKALREYQQELSLATKQASASSDEALYLARLHSLRRAGFSPEEANQMLKCLRT